MKNSWCRTVTIKSPSHMNEWLNDPNNCEFMYSLLWTVMGNSMYARKHSHEKCMGQCCDNQVSFSFERPWQSWTLTLSGLDTERGFHRSMDQEWKGSHENCKQQNHDNKVSFSFEWPMTIKSLTDLNDTISHASWSRPGHIQKCDNKVSFSFEWTRTIKSLSDLNHTNSCAYGLGLVIFSQNYDNKVSFSFKWTMTIKSLFGLNDTNNRGPGHVQSKASCLCL